MRYVVVFLLATLAVPAPAQPQVDSSEVRRVRYTRLDVVEEDQASLWSGERAEVGFYFVELEDLSNGQTIRGVEVEVARQEREQTGGSLSLGSVGSLFGGSASTTYRRIQNSGYYFLRPDDVGTVVSFLDSVVVNLGREQEQMSMWKVSIREGFELGMRYDPDASYSEDEKSSPQARPKWKFIVTAGDATYRLDYQKGLEVIRTLSQWRKRIHDP